MKTDRRVRSQVRTQWLALGGALVVLAGVVVAWALSSAADRVQVVKVVQEVPAGQPIPVEALAVTGVAYDAGVDGLVPSASLADLSGRIAAIDLRPGALVQTGMWRDTPALYAGEQRVGVVLRAGRLPADLGQGDTAVAAAVDAADPFVPAGVRVLDAVPGTDGTTALTLAVPEADAVAVARLAANDLLVLVGDAPAGAATEEEAP
ncbi:MAG: hypothetical protein RL238_1846 [Actinomycetota bacterium]|jgi:hypothetical protein